MPARPNEKQEQIDQLLEALVLIGNTAECRDFLYDLCTMKEIEDMAQRLQVAGLLLQGYTYEKIVQQVDISTATISRINRSIRYGSGGYKALLEKMNSREDR